MHTSFYSIVVFGPEFLFLLSVVELVSSPGSEWALCIMSLLCVASTQLLSKFVDAVDWHIAQH